MGRAWISAFGGLVVLAGCGAFDAQSDPAPPTGDGGSAFDAVADAGADDAEASSVPDDGAPAAMSCPPTGFCVLATGLQDLGSIAVAGNNVYFTRHQAAGAILQVPSNGGSITTFLSPSRLPAALYATPTTLYWITEGDNGIARHTFGMTTEVSTNGTTFAAAQIAGIGPETFWTVPGMDATSGAVRRSTTPTLDPGVDIATGLALPSALAVDSSYVYYATKTTSGHIVRRGHTGSPIESSTLVFNDINAIALSSTAGIAALTSGDGVYRVSTLVAGNFTNAWIQVSAHATAVAMVADDVSGTLYVLAADGMVEVIPNVTPPSSKSLKAGGCSGGRALAQDATHVYLACIDSIVRLPK